MQALWMLLASLFFSAMSVCVKFAAIHFNTAELVCYRGAIGTLIMVVVCHRQGIDLKTPVPMMHLWLAPTCLRAHAASPRMRPRDLKLHHYMRVEEAKVARRRGGGVLGRLVLRHH